MRIYCKVEFNRAVEGMPVANPEALLQRLLTEHFGQDVVPVGPVTEAFHGVHQGLEFGLGDPRRQLYVLFQPTTQLARLLGWMAVSALQWQSVKTHKSKTRPVLLVGADRIGAKTVRAVEAFMGEALPGWEWGVFDLHGMVRLHLPSLRIDVDRRRVSVRGDTPSRRSRTIFSDLNQWMMKILLLRPVASNLWGGPREAVGTPTDLHRVAGVSVETAHRFVRTFEERDFLRRTSAGLRIVRAEALLDTWLAAERLSPRWPIAVAWFLERPASLVDAFPDADDTKAIVGGFEACRRHGLLHASTDVLEIHVLGDWERDLPRWPFERCAQDKADLFLVPSRLSTSIGRGSVVGVDLPTVDVLQAALDVAHSAARGTEQAQFLIDHILGAQPKELR